MPSDASGSTSRSEAHAERTAPLLTLSRSEAHPERGWADHAESTTSCEAPPALTDGAGRVAAEIMRIGWPVIFSNLVQVAQGMATLWFLGSQGDEVAMAAFGLAGVVCGVTGRSLLWGLGSAYDTFASQAWGAKEYGTLGIYQGRVLLLLTVLINAPVTPLWLCAEPILIALGQQPDVSRGVAMFAAVSLPGQFCAALVCVLTKTLIAMGKTQALLALNVASVVSGAVTHGAQLPVRSVRRAPQRSRHCACCRSSGWR